LPDGTGTQRQLVDPDGEITLAASYTPWGDALSVSGDGDFTFGYFGGIMDTTTGLLYVGNGQYYDPATGRFINRNVNPDSANPYVPWGGEPTGALIGPLVLLAMLYSRKKRRGKLDMLVLLLVLCLSVGMTLMACGPDTPQGESSPTSEPQSTQSNQDNNAPTQPPVLGTPGGETDKGSNPENPGSGNKNPSADSTVECYGTPTPTPTPISEWKTLGTFNLSAYYITGESQYYSGKGTNTTVRLKDGSQLSANKYFLLSEAGVCTEGFGRLNSGDFIACHTNLPWDHREPEKGPWAYQYNMPSDPNIGKNQYWWMITDPGLATLESGELKYVPFETVAICSQIGILYDGSVEIRINSTELINIFSINGLDNDNIFTVTDVGGKLCSTNPIGIDLYLGQQPSFREQSNNSFFNDLVSPIINIDATSVEWRNKQ
jgi:RHS repeat-associated protein